ncbi:hypothetical protein ACFVW2_32440 [Streptomyces sp. NPDC058171]
MVDGAEAAAVDVDDGVAAGEFDRGKPGVQPPFSDPLTYSATANRDGSIDLVRRATTVIVIAGDKVPSVHLPYRTYRSQPPPVCTQPR